MITFMASADTQLIPFNSYANISFDSTRKRTGSYSYKVSGGSYFTKSVAISSYTPYVRFAILVTGAVAHNFSFREAATTHVAVDMNFSTGVVSVRRGSTTIHGYQANLATNTWYLFEAQTYIHDTAGFVYVRLNGQQIIALENIDTRDGAAGLCDHFRFETSLYGDAYVDDIMFRTDTWPGSGGIYTSKPNGAGTNAQWTASAGQPYECVDETPSTFTDYIYTNNDNLNYKHDFAHSGIPNINYQSITGVGVWALAKMQVSGNAALRTYYIDPNVTSNSGSEKTLDVSGVIVDSYYFSNGTEPWTRTQVNRIHVGVEVMEIP